MWSHNKHLIIFHLQHAFLYKALCTNHGVLSCTSMKVHLHTTSILGSHTSTGLHTNSRHQFALFISRTAQSLLQGGVGWREPAVCGVAVGICVHGFIFIGIVWITDISIVLFLPSTCSRFLKIFFIWISDCFAKMESGWQGLRVLKMVIDPSSKSGESSTNKQH